MIKKVVKRILNFVDAKIFNKKLRSIYDKIKEQRKNKFFKGKKSVIVEIPVSDFLVMQYNKKEHLQYQFYDLGVRYLAVENYYGLNDDGFELYKKMHTMGGNYGNVNKTEQYYQKMKRKNKTAHYGRFLEQHSIEQFSELILSYEQNGYNPESTIMCDKNMLNMNGSHRATLAVYRNQEFINVDVHNQEFKRRFTLDWFWQNGFTNEEIVRIKATVDKLIDNAHKNIGDFCCILYPPAKSYFDDIVEDIKLVDPDNIKVKDYSDLELYVDEFIGLLKCIYSFDSINETNLNRKIEYILAASDIVDNKVCVRTVNLEINDPMYRVKTDNGKPESLATVRLKEDIRFRYKRLDERFTPFKNGGFNHDVIIHSTDNYLSNKAIKLIDNIDYDLSDLFVKLADYRYAIIESGIKKSHPCFPKKFYLNDDIDIFVNETDIDEIVKITYDFCSSHFKGDWWRVDVVESIYGKRVRVYLKDCLIIMFDYMLRLEGLTSQFISKAIDERIWTNNCAHLNIQNESTVRLAKFSQNPNKVWHKDFIGENKAKDSISFDAKAFTKSKSMKKIYERI